MITIEKNIPLKFKSKYDKHIKAMISLKKDESFLVNDYKIVDAVRNFAWKNGYKIAFRTIAKEQFRIWKLK